MDLFETWKKRIICLMEKGMESRKLRGKKLPTKLESQRVNNKQNGK